jgi:SAM-dependent methyltransferase
MTDRAALAWYTRAFDDLYLELYPHRTPEEAAADVDWVIRETRLPRAARVLDFCCGSGRHLRAWQAHDYFCAGFDLSRELLRRARRDLGPSARLARSDMRILPFAAEAFDLVASFFTSFGYFDEESDDRAVLCGIARVLRPGGLFMLDFLNATAVRATLVPSSHTVRGELDIEQTRSIDETRGRVEKIVSVRRNGIPLDTRRESVRLYSALELGVMFEDAGLIVDRRFGSLRGDPHDPHAQRLVLLARKRG